MPPPKLRSLFGADALPKLDLTKLFLAQNPVHTYSFKNADPDGSFHGRSDDVDGSVHDRGGDSARPHYHPHSSLPPDQIASVDASLPSDQITPVDSPMPKSSPHRADRERMDAMRQRLLDPGARKGGLGTIMTSIAENDESAVADLRKHVQTFVNIDEPRSVADSIDKSEEFMKSTQKMIQSGAFERIIQRVKDTVARSNGMFDDINLLIAALRNVARYALLLEESVKIDRQRDLHILITYAWFANNVLDDDADNAIEYRRELGVDMNDTMGSFKKVSVPDPITGTSRLDAFIERVIS